MNGGTSGVSWASAKAKSDEVKGYPSFSTRNNGFFSRQSRKLSASLPRFNLPSRRNYREKEKLGRGRWYPDNGRRLGRLKTFIGRIFRRMRLRFLLLITFIIFVFLFYVTREYRFLS
jgi:mannan polymerase II complex MNN10 subunit